MRLNNSSARKASSHGRWARSTILGVALTIAFAPVIVASNNVDFGAGPDAWKDDLAPIGTDDWSKARAAHLLERAGFGGTPEELDRLAAMTPAEAVAFLVNYDSVDPGPEPAFEESGIYPHGHKFKPITELAKDAAATGMVLGIKALQEGKLPMQPGINEFYTLLWSDFGEINRAGQWWAERMLTTSRPFQERLTLFWHDHFATSQEKVHRHRKMISHIDTLRQNANGDFRSLLVAMSQDPAMLIWLDNKDNVKGHPNENYAREIMELFTMGEGNGYTEQDIREVARAFTGWTITADETTADGAGTFVDRPDLHDDGEKTIFGKIGKFDGYQAIDLILEQPATARYLVTKLYEYFVRENPSSATVDRLAKEFKDGGYEIAPLMTKIFQSKDFYSKASVGSMIKSPVHLVVSTYRKLGLTEIPGLPDFGETTGSLGQSLFLPPNVAGWPGHRSWINPATLLNRGNFVQTLLFPPDPMEIEPPDKDIHEGYRKIPVMFPDYGIEGHIWNNETGSMEPVPLVLYDKYLTGMHPNEVFAALKSGAASQMTMSDDASMSGAAKGESRMAQVAHGEQFNLAVGVYTGHVEANRRVKPIARTAAQLDMVRMAADYDIETVDQLVDHLIQHFLRVELQSARRDAIRDFAIAELDGEADLPKEILSAVDSQVGNDGASSAAVAQQANEERASLEQALRRVLHLVLSAPEYQLG